MSQFTSHVGWSQLIAVFTAVVGAWYFYGASKHLLAGSVKIGEAIRSFGLGLAWLSVWGIYNPRDLAMLVPFLVKGVFILGGIAFVIGLVWSVMTNFQLPWKRRESKHSTQTA